MAAETANFIHQLVATAPAGGEPVGEGDDHLRTIKTAVKGSFPNFGTDGDSGAVTLKADEINALPTAITDENTAMQAEVAAIVPHVVPQGVILMWSGALAAVPSGWGLCDGAFDADLGANKPDLRDKFIVGAGTTYAVGDTGGSVAKTTSEAGAHDHGGATGDHALTLAQMPKHRHYQYVDIELNMPNGAGPPQFGVTADTAPAAYLRGTSASDYDTCRSYDYRNTPPALVDGIRGGEPTLGMTSFQKDNTGADPAGYGAVHSHSIASDGAHTHGITNALPPYFALAYIIKTTAYEDPTP